MTARMATASAVLWVLLGASLAAAPAPLLRAAAPAPEVWRWDDPNDASDWHAVTLFPNGRCVLRGGCGGSEGSWAGSYRRNARTYNEMTVYLDSDSGRPELCFFIEETDGDGPCLLRYGRRYRRVK